MEDIITWKDKVKTWFIEGHGSSKDPLNLKWDVTEEEIGSGTAISAKHLKIPFEINATVSESMIRLVINTGIETDFLEPADRLKIYKVLLTLNSESSLVKIGITGLESVIVVGADLEIPSLDRDEFNVTLSSLVMTTYAVYRYLGKEKELNDFAVQRILQLAYERLESGGQSSDVVEYLTGKVGLERAQAEEIVRSILEQRKDRMVRSKKDGDLVYIG